MHAIIDTSVKNAQKYYLTYKREPSPAGDIQISQVVGWKKADVTLVKVLEYIKQLGAGAELLIATHSDPKGLMMKLIKGGKVSAITSVLEKILDIDDGIRQREAIRKLPESKQPAAWQAWFKKFESGVVLEDGFEENDAWKAYVEKKYKQWYKRQGATTLGLPDAEKDLKKLMDLVHDVQQLKVKRIEFRACRIGTDKTTLKKIATFFNATKIIAPKEVRTFYGVISTVDYYADPKKFASKLKALKPRRMFGNLQLGLKVGENTFKAIATDKAQVKSFVKGYIRGDYGGGVAPFVIGGLEPAGAQKSALPGKPHVYPRESEYKKLLTLYDASPTTKKSASGSP